MISAETFYGKAKLLALSADRTLHPGEARMYCHHSGAFGYLLPNPVRIKSGGPIFYLWNASGATRDIKSNLGAVITTLANGSVALICLTGTTWYIDIRPKLT